MTSLLSRAAAPSGEKVHLDREAEGCGWHHQVLSLDPLRSICRFSLFRGRGDHGFPRVATRLVRLEIHASRKSSAHSVLVCLDHFVANFPFYNKVDSTNRCEALKEVMSLKYFKYQNISLLPNNSISHPIIQML